MSPELFEVLESFNQINSISKQPSVILKMIKNMYWERVLIKICYCVVFLSNVIQNLLAWFDTKILCCAYIKYNGKFDGMGSRKLCVHPLSTKARPL